MRLRTRFALALVLVALVLSATSLVGFVLYRDAVVAQERTELAHSAESVATQLDAVLAERERQVELWGSSPSLAEHGSPPQEARLRSFVQTTEFSGASVISANGTMVGLHSEGLTSTARERVVGQQFGDRTYFRRAMAGETYVSDPVRAETGNLIVTVSTPLRRSGETVGTFNAAFHLERGDLSAIVRANSGPTQGIRIAANGTTLYAVGPVSGGDADADLILANETVGGTGWTVSATTTRAAFESQLWAATAAQAAAFGLVLLSIAALGLWLYREFVGNIERLHGGFGALADGDYGSTVSLTGATEWAELEGGFNDLSEVLAQRRSEVIVLNRVLRHNLRNAMTVVVGNADRIAERTDDETTRTEADRIRRRGESLLELADHARAIESSLGARPDETATRPADAIIEDVATTLREEFPDADVRPSGPEEPVAVLDGDLLLVALDELARNAITHNDAPTPAVEIDAVVDDGTVTFTVADDGPGMPAVERRVLTDSFVETPTQHGAGLGLWLVTWLVHWADGEVSVDVDDGTTVSVAVSCEPAEPAGPDADSTDE
ncbi:histidine kinase [Halosimplex carlsbadense 2-9-1]|uniref:histidine kinase n=1 Tax=Halosimplex carlsbadense 2-9-1 TaxID=797114 RepID=M0D539_9EURY|nr:sensor histidine kinase [Halosimplex carlsbadense]ELZ30601.1 histidine kinase [Halosimplex carlsbadense 2-9-1]